MSLKDYSLRPPAKPADPFRNLDQMPDTELLQLRNRIDKRLNIDPRNLNLADELGAQYRAGKALLASIQDDEDVPANQRAQVFNSVGTMLQQIAKQMNGVYDAERLKRYEAAWMKVMLDLPEGSRRMFYDLYGDYLKEEK